MYVIFFLGECGTKYDKYNSELIYNLIFKIKHDKKLILERSYNESKWKKIHFNMD